MALVLAAARRAKHMDVLAVGVVVGVSGPQQGRRGRIGRCFGGAVGCRAGSAVYSYQRALRDL